jgi:hypothetical protein
MAWFQEILLHKHTHDDIKCLFFYGSNPNGLEDLEEASLAPDSGSGLMGQCGMLCPN